ncbi:MAG: S8 family peptidase [Bacteroidia bacterium]|nr:S8 family peptidase [Bacteroidia bacterium]
MKKILLAALCAFTLSEVAAQTPMKYWVQFTDKGNNPYSLSNPSAYLSSRALQRRANQGIAIDSLDLPVTPMYVAGVAATGVTVHAQSKWLNGVVIITSDTNDLNAIAALPYVVSTGFVGARLDGDGMFEDKHNETFAPYVGNRATGTVESTMLNYGTAFDQANQIGAVCLHNAGYTGSGMVIAVIDAGFRDVDIHPVFDSLHAYNRILGTWDFVAGDTSVYEDNSHGAMVLSCMGGNIPGTIVGTAPHAQYWLLRSEEAATEFIVEEYLWSCAAEYADSVGADLINSSLGYTTFDDPAQNHTYADMNGDIAPCTRAADYAASRGIVVVNSAGNSGSSSWFYIGAPADADSILAVGAVNVSGTIAGFSSHGPTSDNRVKPDACARGENCVIVDLGGTIQTGNGTSFASPVLCGAVACLWQAHPSMSNMTIVNTVRQAGSMYANPDSAYGYGIPDLCAANLALSGSTFAPSGNDEIVQLGANPFDENYSFTFYSQRDQQISMQITDINGQLILSQQMFAAGNSMNYYTISQLNSLADGMYFLTIVSGPNVFTEKLVKVESE